MAGTRPKLTDGRDLISVVERLEGQVDRLFEKLERLEDRLDRLGARVGNIKPE